VSDRFLTGVKPQEYYFHCMAGREGLVDTAVKTSRSGYLQRCLVKHMEELRVHYDFTVRDSSGSIVQFNYGEDGLDPVQSSLLGGKDNQLLFLDKNSQAFVHKYNMGTEFFSKAAEGGLQLNPSLEHHQRMQSAIDLINRKKLISSGKGSDVDWISAINKGSVVHAKRKLFPHAAWSRGNLQSQWETATVLKVRTSSGEALLDVQYVDGHVEKKMPFCLWFSPRTKQHSSSRTEKISVALIRPGLPDPAMSVLPLERTVGACSEKIQSALVSYMKNNPTASKQSLQLLVWMKYMRSMACAGDAVGCIAAQSVGEPSTQMTLNTFHLAGHGGANVTLGIPRLREVIMTASKSQKTPTMTLPLQSHCDLIDAKLLARKLSQLPLSTLLSHQAGVIVREEIGCGLQVGGESVWNRMYVVRLVFEDVRQIKAVFAIDFDTILQTVKTTFSKNLVLGVKYEQRKSGDKIMSAKKDLIMEFKSNARDVQSYAKDGDEANGDDGDGGETDKKKNSFNLAEESDESDNEDDEVDGETAVRKVKEGVEYEADEGEHDGNEETAVEGEQSDTDEEGALVSSSSTPLKRKVPVVEEVKNSGKKKEVELLDSQSFSFNEEEGWVELRLYVAAGSRRLMMAQIADKVAKRCMIRCTKDITVAHPVALPSSPANPTEGYSVVTEGVNFEAVWSLPESLVNFNAIDCNDIYSVLLTYGVEAARCAIVSEITAVFAVYGIDVNPRHLSLIADFMTRRGTYAAMNRIGMMDCPSPFLQMSFETTLTFLTKAAIEGNCDNLQSPSARIVMGSVPKVGTGCFDLMIPLEKK